VVTESKELKVTYTTMSVDQLDEFNRAYESALREVGNQLGRDYPVYIGNQPVTAAGANFEDRSPSDQRVLLGTFQECGAQEAQQAVEAARGAFAVWSHTPWTERLAVMRKAAQNFRSRKYEMAAWLSLEAGKSRLEAMGEVEEAADLITTYADQMEQHNGYVIKLGQLSSTEVNHSVLRPYGVWVVISPFNFPIALTTGMLAGALTAGNTAVFKPSEQTPLTGVKVFECLRDAGLPVGALNFVTGQGDEIGEALSSNPDVDGIVFTGSARVGTHVYREFSSERPRPCIAEMGGKNPVIVMDDADLDKAVEGTARAAFGFSGQKCSAASRVYVHSAVADEFLRRLVERSQQLSIGDPAKEDVFTGPVISQAAYTRFKECSERARLDGEILLGGTVIDDGELGHGFFCSPTIARLPKDHPFFYEELFVPLVAVATVDSFEEAITLANDSKYGLTAGLFSENRDTIDRFLDEIEVGVAYANRKAGATTGAWPGIQSFGGWKMSGSTGKSALGPYYVQQFMHEQTQTIVFD
jgi:1-pyrroline-5-carboxylate dehydrogenase